MQGMPLELSADDEGNAGGTSGGEKGLSQEAKIAIGVPAALAVLLAACVLGMMCMRRRRANSTGKSEATAGHATSQKSQVRSRPISHALGQCKVHAYQIGSS